jgi:thioesterase domain-containing protein
MRRKFYTILRGNTKSLSIFPENTKIVPLQPEGVQPIFFMVDSYPFFIDVVQLMGADHPVLSLIGQEDTQTTQTYSIFDEATDHVNSILDRQPRGPYFLGGCSASGIVAYEIAQQLHRLGHEIGLLVLFDTPNPYFMGEYSAWRRSLASFRADLSFMQMREVPAWFAGKARGRLGKINAWLASAWHAPLHYAPSVEQLRPLEIRIAAARRYRPAPYSGPLLLVKRELKQQTGRYLDPQYGWDEVANGNFEICEVGAADHLDIFRDETDRVMVARRLRCHLDGLASYRGTHYRDGDGVDDLPLHAAAVEATKDRHSR